MYPQSVQWGPQRQIACHDQGRILTLSQWEGSFKVTHLEAQSKHKACDILIHFEFIKVTTKEGFLKSILKKDLAPRSYL